MKHSVGIALALVLLLGGCGAAQKQALSHAHDGVETALQVAKTMSEELAGWDKEAQALIVKRAQTEEEGQAALERYRDTRERVRLIFNEAFDAIYTAAGLLVLYDAGEAKVAEVVKALKDVAAAVKEAQAAFKTLRGL